MSKTKNIRCPKCSSWISYNPDIHVDIVHKCVKSDGTRLKSRDPEDHQGFDTLRMDIDHWNTLGMDPQMPDSTITHTEFKKHAKEIKEVDTFIVLE